tara:strand:- start:6142 stop:6687 length:546 start_codon:yes stop_codon:yes gene_type:complete
LKGYEYYSIGEFEQAVLSDDDNLSLKCMAIAARLVNKYSLRMDGSDLYHEGIFRILADSRHIPKDIPLVVSIGQIMKGIAYDTFERKDEELLRSSDSIEMNEDKISPAVDSYDSSLEDIWKELESMFTDDSDALSFLKATSDGQKKSNIVDSIFAGDINRYDTTRRRIIRRGHKLKQEVQK